MVFEEIYSYELGHNNGHAWEPLDSDLVSTLTTQTKTNQGHNN